ncbi:type I restriction enzyme%2C S subunit [Yersinia enterocolitica]|uniref:restriction endonuclease subunit S n=1 Tax=Yersinia enterocolitica TaxID=630 RepID=UPI0006582807|nr:restriction endonuclease subunit S [Yersinia enterocolitica]CRX45678.1 type I restriction enzyme%2C S subunit [Yersinia enterocolitica]
MVPKLRFREFGDCWVQCNIQDLVNDFVIDKPMDGNHGEIHPVSTDYIDNGIPFIMASDIIDGEIDFIGCKKIKLEQATNLRKGFSLTGDILLTHKATIGNVAIVPELPYPFIMLTPQVTYYRVINNTKLLNRYMRYFFETPFFIKELTELCTGATRPYIGISEQRKLPFRHCSIKEQYKIADFLSSVDEKISLLNKQYNLLCQYKKEVMRKIFSQELRFTDKNGGDFPEWEYGAISELISNKSEKYNPQDGISYPCVELDCISQEDGKLLKTVNSLLQKSIKNTFKKGDVLFGKLRPYLRKYILAPFDGVCSSEIWVLKGILMNNYFLYQFIQTDFFINLANKSTGSKMPRADWDTISSTFISYPGKEEQTKIANFLSAIDDKITEKKVELDKLKTWKQGLLQQMFV